MLKAISPRRSVWVGSVLLALISLPAFAQHYTRTDLTANVPSVTTNPNVNIDPHLLNAWGLSRTSGSPWWVSDQGAAVATLYNAAGARRRWL